MSKKSPAETDRDCDDRHAFEDQGMTIIAADGVRPPGGGRLLEGVRICAADTARATAVTGRPSTDGNGDEPQKLVVRHRLFQHGHHPQAGGLAFDLGVMNAGDQ